MEGISQQDAEYKVNKVMDIAAGYKPTIWDFLCVLGVAFLQGRAQDHERERMMTLEIIRRKTSKAARQKRAAAARKAGKKDTSEKQITK